MKNKKDDLDDCTHVAKPNAFIPQIMTPPTTTLKDEAKRITALEIFNNLERAETQSIDCYVLTSRHEFCDYEIHEAIVKDLQQQLAEKDKKIEILSTNMEGAVKFMEEFGRMERQLAENKEDKKVLVKISNNLNKELADYKAKVQEIDSLLDDEKWLTAQLLLKKLLSGEGEQ